MAMSGSRKMFFLNGAPYFIISDVDFAPAMGPSVRQDGRLVSPKLCWGTYMGMAINDHIIPPFDQTEN
jgi:hypothetical protein